MNVANSPLVSGSIRFLTGPLAGSTFQISKPLITIGRDPGNDIVISDPTISRQHARLINNADQWSIEKLATQNVVTVNQHPVQQTVISDRDTIGLGTGTTFLFLKSSPQSPTPLDLLVCISSYDIATRCSNILLSETKRCPNVIQWYFLAPLLFIHILLCYCSIGLERKVLLRERASEQCY